MNNKGITLIELIVTIGILGIIIIPLSSFFITSAKTNKMTDEKYEATLLAQSMIESIKSLEDINKSSLENNFDNLINYNDANDNILFNYKPLNSHNKLIASVNIAKHVYNYQDDSDDDSDDNSKKVHIIINETESGYEVVLKRYSPPVFENFKDDNGNNSGDKSIVFNGEDLHLVLYEDKNKIYLKIIGANRTEEIRVKTNKNLDNKLNILNLTSDLNISDFIDDDSEIKFGDLSGSSSQNEEGLKFYEINVMVNKDSKELESLKGSMIIYE